MSNFKISLVMSQNNTISVKAKNIVDNFINKNWSRSNSISRTDVMKHVIVTLYAQMPNAKAELIQPFKDCIFDLSEHFTQEEIELISNEASAIIRYCYEFVDVMGHIDFDDDSELVEEIVSKDEPLNIYKTPESLIELCEKLSGKHGTKDNVYLPYADFSDFALYYPEANYHIECNNQNYGEGQGYNFVNSYVQLLLNSQGIKAETVYDDCDWADELEYLKTQPDYVFAFNPTLNKTCNNVLSLIDGMWQCPLKVSAKELALKITFCAISVKPGSCLDFIFPIGYLQDKSFWERIEKLMDVKEMAFNVTFIKLPSMQFGGTYVSTFLLHIEKDKGNSGMMRLIDATDSDFYKNGGLTNDGQKQLFNFLDEKKEEPFSYTDPKFYQKRGLNVERIMELYNQEECDARYEERIHYRQFFGKNIHVANQYLIDKKMPELPEGVKYIQLKDLVDIVPLGNVDEGSEIQVLDKKKLSSEYMDCAVNATLLTTQKLEVSNDYFSAPIYQSVTNDCLIVGIVSGKLKVGKLNNVECPVAFKEGLVAFKLKCKEVSEDYLLRELAEDYCTMQAMMLANHRIDLRNEEDILEPEYLLEIKIGMPALEEQERLCREDIHDYLQEADRKLIQSAEEFKRDVHMKKHAIGQTLFNLSNWWDLLQKARKEGNGIVDESQEVGKIRKTKVVDIYSNIQMTLEKLQMQVDGFWRADGLQVENISLTAFVKEYVKEHQSPLFVYEYDSISTLVNNNVPKVAFSKQALTMVFDNIINNACSHGFENKASESNIVKIEVQMDNGLPYIVISNNGNPVHEKISSEDVFTYGRSSKSGQAHYGIGGYEVRNLMREFQGEAEFISTPQEDFPVSYKLSFREVSNNV